MLFRYSGAMFRRHRAPAPQKNAADAKLNI